MTEQYHEGTHLVREARMRKCGIIGCGNVGATTAFTNVFGGVFGNVLNLFIVISCLLVKYLGGDIFRTAQLFSKEIENSSENVDALLDAAYAHPAFTDDRLLGLLLIGNKRIDLLRRN